MAGPFILMLASNTGGGHASHCGAVSHHLRELRPGVRIELLDFIATFAGEEVARRGRANYARSVRYTPRLYGWYHAIAGRIPPSGFIQRRINRTGQAALRDYCSEHRPDLIVCNYPAAGCAAQELRRAGQLPCPVVSMVCDYDVNNQWVHLGSDLTLAPAEWVREGMIGRGLEPSRVLTTGMAIRPQFAESYDRAAMRRKWGLPQGARVVLVLAGAHGMMRGVSEALEAVRGAPGAHGVFVTGHAASMREWLTGRRGADAERLHILGYVADLHELMAFADVCITKAGPQTCAEAMAQLLPIIIHRPIPGQEGSNMRYLVSLGVATVTRGGDLRRVLPELLSDEGALSAMRECARTARWPLAARDAAEALLWVLDGAEGLSPPRRRCSVRAGPRGARLGGLPSAFAAGCGTHGPGWRPAGGSSPRRRRWPVPSS
jgi:processive 1,2-diacylglycerol beta-glucosyltransferase